MDIRWQQKPTRRLSMGFGGDPNIICRLHKKNEPPNDRETLQCLVSIDGQHLGGLIILVSSGEGTAEAA